MATDKPNVLLMLADDVGWLDVSAYHRGIMGTRTANIDRGHLRGVPAAPGAARLHPQGLVDAVMAAAAQRHGN